MMELTEVQKFIKEMFDVNDQVREGRFEVQFPDADDCQTLINFMRSRLEFGCMIKSFDMLNDSADQMQGFRDRHEIARANYDHTMLACSEYIAEVKAEIDDIEEVNEIEASENVVSFKIIGSREA